MAEIRKEENGYSMTGKKGARKEGTKVEIEIVRGLKTGGELNLQLD